MILDQIVIPGLLTVITILLSVIGFFLSNLYRSFQKMQSTMSEFSAKIAVIESFFEDVIKRQLKDQETDIQKLEERVRLLERQSHT